MVVKILCVAEKPSIARAVSDHLSGGTATPVGGHALIFSFLVLTLCRTTLAVQHGSRTTNSLTLFQHGDLAMLL